MNISIHSKDIRAQSGKGSGIVPNLACICPQNFLGGRLSNFWTGIYKLNMLLNTWQNFTEIGPRTSKIHDEKKE